MRLGNLLTPKNDKPARVKVCHITTVHWPWDTRIFFRECLCLEQAGYDVHLITCHDHDEDSHGIQIHALPFPPNPWLRMLFWPFLALRKAMRIKANIYHLHDPELVFLAAALRFTTDAKVIFDAHEDIPAQILTKPWIPRPLRWIMANIIRLIYSFALLGTPVIESDMIKGQFRQPKQSIRNFPLLEPGELTPRTREDFTAPFAMVYVGNVSDIRGVWTMLALADGLMKRGIDFVLRIIGPVVPESLLARLQKFLETTNLSDRVYFLGRLPFPKAMQWVKRSTIGLSLLKPVANHRYALPTKLLEYMAYGLPVIATDMPCTREYITYCDAGILVNPDTPQDLLEQAVQLLSDPDRMLQFSRHGQARVCEELNWKNESRYLLRFYRRILYTDVSPDPCWYHCRRH